MSKRSKGTKVILEVFLIQKAKAKTSNKIDEDWAHGEVSFP